MSGMAWDCTTDGCWTRKKQLNLTKFAPCFSGKISPTDIDFLVERNGYFAMIEWKSIYADAPLLEGFAMQPYIKKGQEIVLRRFGQKEGNISFAVLGDAKDMSVRAYRKFTPEEGGLRHKWEVADFKGLCTCITKWYEWADKQPCPPE